MNASYGLMKKGTLVVPPLTASASAVKKGRGPSLLGGSDGRCHVGEESAAADHELLQARLAWVPPCTRPQSEWAFGLGPFSSQGLAMSIRPGDCGNPTDAILLQPRSMKSCRNTSG